MEECTINGGNRTPVNIEKPWGTERTLDVSRYYAMKQVVILPGEAISQQGHVEKFESYWIARGDGRVVLGPNGEFVHLVSAGDVVYIPAGTIHQAFAGAAGLEIIEVSTPEVLDVMRFTDRYGRPVSKFNFVHYREILLGKP